MTGGWCETHGGYTGSRCAGRQFDDRECVPPRVANSDAWLQNEVGVLPVRHITFEIVLHEENTPWAEWDVFWHDGEHADAPEEVITRGTAPSLEAALDKAWSGYSDWCVHRA